LLFFVLPSKNHKDTGIELNLPGFDRNGIVQLSHLFELPLLIERQQIKKAISLSSVADPDYFIPDKEPQNLFIPDPDPGSSIKRVAN
jgi:hypothetical protein